MHILIPCLHRPSKPTGVCRHAANLARCLATNNHVNEISLIVGKWQLGYFQSSFNLDSVKIKIIAVDIQNNSPSRNLWFILGLPELTREIQPDIIHFSFPFPFIRRWFEPPVVSTIHDLYPYEYSENFGYPWVWFNQLFFQQCIYNSDGLLCVSECTLNSLKRHFPKIALDKPSTVIYNVVNFADVKSRIPKFVDDILSSSFLLTVAQHRKNKNLDLLIHVYSNLLKDGTLSSDTRLFLVGSTGPTTGLLRELIETLDLEKKVFFFSGVADDELRWLYEHASLFIIPSSTEGFCLPLVEALECGCPTICSDIPIFREIASEKSSYFCLDNKAAKNLREAISTQLSKPNNRKRTSDIRFSKETVKNQLLKYYKKFM